MKGDFHPELQCLFCPLFFMFNMVFCFIGLNPDIFATDEALEL